VVVPGGGTGSAMAREVATGLTMACPVQPAVAPTQPATSVVVLGRPALVTEIPALVKAGAAVVTLHHREESRGTAVLRQQERHSPVQRVQTPLVTAFVSTSKRASKCTSEKPPGR
jgi:hypothetical protein